MALPASMLTQPNPEIIMLPVIMLRIKLHLQQAKLQLACWLYRLYLCTMQPSGRCYGQQVVLQGVWGLEQGQWRGGEF